MTRITTSIISGLVCLIVGGVISRWSGVPVRQWIFPAVVTSVVVMASSYFGKP
jgi:VIT1/CCC1 family predicted Fe2+/Mn2+ transporter